jgi:hypothetical protein
MPTMVLAKHPTMMIDSPEKRATAAKLRGMSIGSITSSTTAPTCIAFEGAPVTAERRGSPPYNLMLPLWMMFSPPQTPVRRAQCLRADLATLG